MVTHHHDGDDRPVVRRCGYCLRVITMMEIATTMAAADWLAAGVMLGGAGGAWWCGDDDDDGRRTTPCQHLLE
jgi:hypothetical protein